MTMRVAIADKDYLVAEGLASLLREHGVSVTGIYTQADALDFGLRSCRADVVILEPMGLSPMGMAVVRKVQGAHPNVRIVILTASTHDEDLLTATRIGVHGYLAKSVSSDNLLLALHAACRGQAMLDPEHTALLLDILRASDRKDSNLTARQTQLLLGIVRGKSNGEIARDLHLTEKTVKNYMRGLYAALGVRDRTEAAVRAFQLDLVDGSDWAPPALGAALQGAHK